MSPSFHRSEPVQAAKLASIVVTLVLATAGFVGLLPGQSVGSLFLVPLLALVLVAVVTAETLLWSYRALRSDDTPSDRLRNRPAYALVRAGEAGVAALAAGSFVFVLWSLPDGPMAGPGAIGLLFVVVGLGLLVVAGCLVRTLTEYYYVRSAAA
jgi:hypothetical protein